MNCDSERPPRQLLLDAGNTRLKWGVFAAGTHPGRLSEPLRSGTLRCGEPLDVPEWCRGLYVGNACLSGSNLYELQRVEAVWKDDFPRLSVWLDRQRFPIQIDVDAPERVGLDRLFNAVAAWHLKPPDRGAIIVDSGTATTVDLLAPDGTFCGGAILPGLLLSSRALHEYTAALPFVPMPEPGEPPPPAVGRNTEAAIISGIRWGHIAAVNGLIETFSNEERLGEQPPLILLTGGASPWLRDWIHPGALEFPHLPLQGLHVIINQSG